MFGLTIEGTDDTKDGTGINLGNLLFVLKQLPHKPILRLCMEFGIEPDIYLPYAKALRGAGYPLMLQPVDSSDMHRYSVSGYSSRFKKTLSILSDYADLIECANEVNGDWCGQDAVGKMEQALELIPNELSRVVTLYVTEGFENFMNGNPILAAGYLFYSVYPNSENSARSFLSRPPPQRGTGTYVGIGEYGSENADGEMGSPDYKKALIQQFESRNLASEMDVGGNFYWDFYDDCVKNGNEGILNAFKKAWTT